MRERPWADFCAISARVMVALVEAAKATRSMRVRRSERNIFEGGRTEKGGVELDEKWGPNGLGPRWEIAFQDHFIYLEQLCSMWRTHVPISSKPSVKPKMGLTGEIFVE